MGEAIASLGWPRHSYVLSTKLFWGIHPGVNMRNTLNRKYLHAGHRRLAGALRPRLRRPRLLPPTRSRDADRGDRVGHVRHHRPAGKALYWGTSEWSAEPLREAWDIADRHHLHKPVVEQPQYNLLWRDRVEKEYAPLYDGIGLGLTTWSPLSSGPADRQVPRRRARGVAGHPARLRVAAATCSPTRSATTRCARSSRSPRSSTARWPSWPSPGAPRTRTSRRSSPEPAGSSRSTRTWPPSTSCPSSPTRCMARIDAVTA